MRHQLGSDEGSSPDAFAIRVAHDPEIVVQARGEIDLAVADTFAAAVDEALQGQSRLILDLSQTTFMDSAGLAVIANAYRDLGRRPESIVLRSPSPAVRRLLATSGVDRFVAVEEPAADQGIG